jgi:hypothetical protein
MADNVVLQDTGYLVNVFQKGMVKKLNLYLYPTHLKIENSDTSEIIDDIPLSDIKKVKNIRSAGEIVIVAPKKHYKISWKNIDTSAMMFGGPGGSLLNAFRGSKQSKQWVATINQYKTNLAV